MKKVIKSIYLLSAITLGLTGCKNEPILNPNAPTIEAIIKNPSIGELNNLVTGSESAMRVELPLYTDIVSIIGREYYYINTSEPRYVQELAGDKDFSLGSSTFYAGNSWLSRYNVVKNCNILLQAVQNCTFLKNDNERNGYIGFAKTIMAYQLLLNLNNVYENGIRVDVADPKKLGPFVTKDEALTAIAGLLDEGATALKNATVLYTLSSGFAGLDDAEGFRKFNRALAARVALYREKWTDALQNISESFVNLPLTNNNLYVGAKHIFSASNGDLLNDMKSLLNGENEARIVQAKYLPEMEAGDDRGSKVAARNKALSAGGLTSNQDVNIYPADVSPVYIIRNEELALIKAEASIQNNDLATAKDILDNIRQIHGLAPTPETTKDGLINEMLKQRRYSLFGEGHRWIDMRRYNRLNQLPLDRQGDQVWKQLPIPNQETTK
ncbi:RagB/SusD family nutrient uptake outer membrane protein [Chitinophaga silvatica]|nr:RagB/SusD family nutrient uptake outer membrane protein [Chitinophaga silvatica]